LSETVIRGIRKRIYNEREDVFASGEDERGKLVTMIASEAEDVGRFAGEAIASPLLQLGTLASVITYVAITQPSLGLFMLAVIFPQAVIVITLQRFVNERVRKRVQILRHATSEITAKDIRETQQSILDDFDEIYEARRGIFVFKLSMKFALNIINGLGTVGILLIGGLLFMNGKTDVGSIVASLSAIGRINDPWRELIAFYRQLSAVRVRFDLLVTR
jgi:ABC-type bacteriocin/lantibiotic exporter with double-glycine peptidase domain